MNLKSPSRYLAGAAAVLMLSACTGDRGFDDIDRFMQEARNAPRGVVEPLPEFQAYEAFSYRSADRRAPFEPPVDVQLTMIDEQLKSDVEPDLDRPKELLEQFELESLDMVGTLRRAGGDTVFALIADSQGGIHRVTKGSHMGMNYGRVVGIENGRIELIEIVPNGRGGWVERPRSLSLEEG